jgi:hypothetical protein
MPLHGLSLTAGSAPVSEVLDADDETRERASAINGTLQTMTIDEWCGRYGIPVSFVTE